MITKESMKNNFRKRQAPSDGFLRPAKQARVEDAWDVKDEQVVDVRELELLDSNHKSRRFVFKMCSKPFLVINTPGGKICTDNSNITPEANVAQRADDNVLDSLQIGGVSAQQYFACNDFRLIWSSANLRERNPDFLRGYTLRSKIGEGGYGQVFHATRNMDNKLVAVKFFKNSFLKERAHACIKSTISNVNMVPTEVNALIELEGVAGMVQPYEIYISDSKNYILVMESFSGAKSLWTYITERGRLTEEEACHYFRQLVHTLNEMYSRKRHHFDIKDENILINSCTGRATLIDFGGAQRVRRKNFKNWIGTKENFPPEYFLEKKFYGIPLESWSLGLLLLQMTTGTLPVTDDVEENSKRNYMAPEELSPDLRNLIEQCLNRRPRSRPNFNKILESPWIKRMNRTYSIVSDFRDPIPIQYFYESDLSPETSPNL